MSTCSICLEGFRNPRELPCHHSFCEVCLQEFIDKLVNDGKGATTFNCPICLRPITQQTPGTPTTEWAKQFPSFQQQSQTKASSNAPLKKSECSVCQNDDGKHVDARKYCIACHEYFCEGCLSLHLRTKILGNHDIIGVNEKEKLAATIQEMICACKLNKKMEYYCQAHKDFCCSSCKKEKHRNCRNARSIADISSEAKKYGDLDRALKKLDWLRDNLRIVAKLLDDNRDLVKRAKSDGIASIKKMFAELKASLEELEASMIQELNSKFDQANDSLTQQKERCNAATGKVEASSTLLKFVREEKETQQRYITFQRIQEDIVNYENGLCNIAANTTTFKLSFQRSQNFQAIEQSLMKCGTVTHKEENDTFSPLAWRSLKIQKPNNLRTVAHSEVKNVTGLVALTHDKIVLVHSYESIELLVKRGQSRYHINGAFDVAAIEENAVAVTSRGCKTIHVLSTDNCINTVLTISTPGECYGIVYCSMTKELAITTCYPNTVQILTLTGDVVTTIKKDKKGQDIFSDCAEYVAVNRTGDMIYVSDSCRGVVGMTRDGNVKFIYKDVKEPRGIDTDRDGNVYVCDLTSNNVLQLTPDGSSTRVLLTAADGLDSPWGFFFNKSEDSFTISQKDGNEILICQMK